MKQNEDIKEYLRGNRKGKDAHHLEQEALSDPFLFEALEGLTTTPDDPIDGLIRLERELDERAHVVRKGRAWLYTVAFLVVLVAGGSLWFTVLQDKQVVTLAGVTSTDSAMEGDVESRVLEYKDISLPVTSDTLQVEANIVVQDKAALDILEKRVPEQPRVVAAQVEKQLPVVAGNEVVVDSVVSASDVANVNHYLMGMLKYPAEDLAKNSEGTISLSFKLNKKKIPSQVKIQGGFSKESNQEIIRLLCGGPRWENSPCGLTIYVTVRFEIGKNGGRNKATLVVVRQER